MENTPSPLLKDIGLLAGDVWHYLDAHGETSSLKLRSVLKVSQSFLYLALGWLAREEKIQIKALERGYKVSLIAPLSGQD